LNSTIISDPKPSGQETIQNGWYSINSVEKMDTFLSTIVSEEDHWMYVASNGGLTAGRVSPQLSLFPYQTQDKLIDLAHTTGPYTLIRFKQTDHADAFWKPMDPRENRFPRKMLKKLDGTQISFIEENRSAGLEFQYNWGFSSKHGFIKRATLRNSGTSKVSLEIIDGLQNLSACDVDPAIYNKFSNLLDAYKRCEKLPETNLRLIYLNSIPTDRAEPMESLRCTSVWSCGLPSPVSLLGENQLGEFQNGGLPIPETETRGQRVSVLDAASLSLDPGEEITWYMVAEVGMTTARASRLDAFLKASSDLELARILESDLEETSISLVEKVASADGLQLTQDSLRNGRHYSNVLFNIMRGGIFPYSYKIPGQHFLDYLSRANRKAYEEFVKQDDAQIDWIERSELVDLVTSMGQPDLERLVSEYLPLAFSRRHGDPSRPWNEFSIRVRDQRGDPILAYQGNWRDIFQNWEALAYSFPEYINGMIARFLNASTADGYNPYRLTSEGFEWETIEPDEPWSNIGYWGDHQLVYLLRLLEVTRKVHPNQLRNLLRRKLFGYARVPYRIRPYSDILNDPRNSILYDDDANADINERVQSIGSDGKLLPAPDGTILRVSMMEKLLVPLLAKLSNFVPSGGIWMNTQRPEWNDANNALAGFGLSVVTLAYAHRYLDFLVDLLEGDSSEDNFLISCEVADLLESQKKVFTSREPFLENNPTQLRVFLDSIGEPASHYRSSLYDNGLSGATREVPTNVILDYLKAASKWVAVSLRANRRSDGLYHSYNLLDIGINGNLGIKYLYEMLEGQVAILSAKLLSPDESLDVLDTLRGSALYRPDQNSYLLYPDRDLPRFLEKNRIPHHVIENSILLQTLGQDSRQSIVESDASGNLSFSGVLHNGGDLLTEIANLEKGYESLLKDEPDTLMKTFEELFQHHAYTGRSGTFFAYEGLGSIYWHMVSKLGLAIQEITLSLAEVSSRSSLLESFEKHYREVVDGLGLKKTAPHYGAFTTDAYSHTPKHAGAQQPGMTGQVKEDILGRLGELGVQIQDGTIQFRPFLLSEEEFLKEEADFEYFTTTGNQSSISIPAGSLVFTLCQVPVIYHKGSESSMQVSFADGSESVYNGILLPKDLSKELFCRSGKVTRIDVHLPDYR